MNDQSNSNSEGQSPADRLSRRRFIKNTALVAAGTTLSSSLLAACGDAATPTAGASATTAASAATSVAASATTIAAAPATTAAGAVVAATGANLKVGLVVPLSGVYAQLGPDIIDGMNLYFDSVGGVVAGRKVELLKEDEENDPQASLRKTNKLIQSDKVDIMAGIVSSAVALALRDVVDQSKMVLVIANAGANALTGARYSKYIFRTSFSNGQVPWPLGTWAYSNVGKKIFVTAPDYSAGHESSDAFKNTFTKAGGTIAGELYPPFGKTSDYAPFLTQIQQAKPDAVYAFYSGSEAVNFVKQYDQFGLKKDIPLIGAGFLIEEDTLGAQGNSALGVKTSLHYALSLDTPENKKFVSDFKAKYNRNPSTFALQGFDTARFIAEGVKAVNGDTTNKDNLIKALEAVKFTGPRGPFELDPTNHGLTQNMYLRDCVAGPDGKPMNKVLQTFEKIKDINTLLKG